MEERPFSDDIRQYLALLWHWGWLLALATVLAGLSAYVVSKQMTPVYQASTTLLVNEARSSTGASSEYTALLTSERLARTYTELMKTNPILDGVIERLGLDLDARDLESMITIQLVRDTQLIEVHVEDTDPVRAAEIANGLSVEFANQNATLQEARYADSKQSLSAQLDQLNQQIENASASLAALGEGDADKLERDRLEQTIAQYRQTYAYLLQSFEQIRVAEAASTSNIVQVEPAVAPERPIRPRTMMNTALAAVVGLMLAVGAVFLIEALDDTVKGPDDITRHLGVPVLGLISSIENEEAGPVTVLRPRSPVSEAFRSLRTNIQYASVDRPLHTLLITSPSPKDGKSTISTNLGVVLSQSGRTVALVDADLRRPTLHKKMRLSNRRGLADLFVQPQVFLDGALRPTKAKGLAVLTSGGLPPNPSELIGSGKMLEILRSLRGQADMVVIDTPPVMAVTDSSVLAPQVDGVLLVVRPGSTRLAFAKQTVEQLQRSGANVLGVVLNDVESKRSRYYYYYKGYYAYQADYYGDGATGKRGRRKVRRKKRPERSDVETTS